MFIPLKCIYSQITKSATPSLKDEPKDETININRELYFDDLKNKTKYAKLFKKPNDSNDQKFPDDTVVTNLYILRISIRRV